LRACSASAGARERSGNGSHAQLRGIRVGRDEAAFGHPLVRSATLASRAMTCTRCIRVAARPRAGCVHHLDAIDRARRDAQLASRAEVRNHRMHALRRADDRIDGAGVDAKRAAYAAALVDDRDTRRPVRAAARVQRGGSLTRQRGEQDDRGVASRGAAIDRCRAARYGFSVGTTPLESAARALRLRQCGIDTLDQGFHDPIVIDENASGGSAKYASGGPG